MTQNELREQIKKVFIYDEDAGFDKELAPCSHDDDFMCEHRLNSIMSFINQHVKEVIGEDEPEIRRGLFGITQSEAYHTARDRAATVNSEKADQRKRAGL